MDFGASSKRVHGGNPGAGRKLGSRSYDFELPQRTGQHRGELLDAGVVALHHEHSCSRDRGALEYTFRVGANIQEREQASHFFRLYKSDGTVSEPAASTDDMFVAQLRYFAHCVAERQPPRLCPPEETCQAMQVMTASRQSAERGGCLLFQSCKLINEGGSRWPNRLVEIVAK